MIMAVLEGVAMCFVLLIICVVGTANGPAGIHLWEDIDRQVGLDVDRLSGIGRYHCLGGCETINRDL